MNKTGHLFCMFVFLIPITLLWCFGCSETFGCNNLKYKKVNSKVIKYNCKEYKKAWTYHFSVEYQFQKKNISCGVKDGDNYYKTYDSCMQDNNLNFPLNSTLEIYVDKQSGVCWKKDYLSTLSTIAIALLLFYCGYYLWIFILETLWNRRTSRQLVMHNQSVRDENLRIDDIEINTTKNKNNFVKITNNINVDKCPICLDEFKVNEEYFKFYCGHSFHSNCIKDWEKINSKCPNCKKEIIIIDV